MQRLPILLVTGLSFLVACAENANTTAPAGPTDDVAVESTEPINDPSAEPLVAVAEDADPKIGTADAELEAPGEITLAQTLGAIESAGDVTQLPPPVAVSVIDGWIVRLDGDPEGEDVSRKLTELRDLLSADAIDGPAVGRLLSELGGATAAMAGDNAEMVQLGDNLSTSSSELLGE